MFEMFCAVKSHSRGTAAEAIALNRTGDETPADEKAHAVFARFCAVNSFSRRTAAGATAVRNARAHAVQPVQV